MGLGGPVWHSSAAAMPGWPAVMQTLRTFALEALEGVGDAGRGEWEEWTGRAYHLRRRLSVHEQAQIGDAVDIRGTAEALRRIERVAKYAKLSPQGIIVMAEEARLSA
jgi:hypothetical protein